MPKMKYFDSATSKWIELDAKNADTLGGKSPSEFANSSHTHTASDLPNGTTGGKGIVQLSSSTSSTSTTLGATASAVKSAYDKAVSVEGKMGILSNLETTNKDNLVEAINEVNSKEVDVSQLAKKVDFDNHVDDTTSHVTQVEKDLWNNKSEFDGDYNSLVNLPNLTQYATVDQLNAKTPVLKDKSNFNSTIGKIISHSIGHTNYYVEVTPSQNPNGYLGEIWVEYSSTSFKVCCSGTATTEFRYVVYA